MADPSPTPPQEAVVDGGTGNEVQVKRLRDRWELASVLNFLSVFEPVIGKELMPDGLIERELIIPTGLLAQLHIKLLKGIPPRSKMLDGSDAWVTVLCKKLIPWWPWVAEGLMPLKPANGEELRQYKELDPVIRLLILKALCELRAHQDDAVSYINTCLKTGTPVSHFRKEKLAGDGGTSYWYDKSTIGGHRLYRKVCDTRSKVENLGEGPVSPPVMSFLWETLASTPEEFRRVADKFAYENSVTEVTVSSILQSDVLPVLEKLQKDQERMLKRKERKEMFLRNCTRSYVVRSIRSSRLHRPASYTFDDYDQAIDDAIGITEKKRIRGDKDEAKGGVDPGMESTEVEPQTMHYEGAENNKEHDECENNVDIEADDLRLSQETGNFKARKRLRSQSPYIPLHDCVVPDSDDENRELLTSGEQVASCK